MADSDAATVRTKRAKTCPTMSSKYTEKITKFISIENNTTSIHIRIISKLVRLDTIPNKPIQKSNDVKSR